MIKNAAVYIFVFLFSVYGQISAEDKNSCEACHGKIKVEFSESIHKTIGMDCVDCHRGNPSLLTRESMSRKYGFKTFVPVEVPKLCAGCHSDVKMMRSYNVRTDQFAEYSESVHGRKVLINKDGNAATCVSCHGTHGIRKKDDPKSQVHKFNIPGTCAGCHSKVAIMRKYGIPTNQFESYSKGVHGKALLEKKNPLAPNCAECHGIHGAYPPGITELGNTCGNCHQENKKYFNASPHKKAMDEKRFEECIACHGNHYIGKAGTDLLTSESKGGCGSCHKKGSPEYGIAVKIKELIDSVDLSLNGLREKMERHEKIGLNMTFAKKEYEHLVTKRKYVSTIQHTLSLTIVKEISENLINYVNELEEKIKAKGRERIYRILFYALMVFIVGTAVVLIFIRKRVFK